VTPLLRLSALRESLRESLWFAPSLAVLVALVAGFLAGQVEVSVRGWLDAALFSGDAESAASLLSTLLGALVTVTGVILSITVVALQMTSQQFSPRVLRRFLRDPGTKVPISVLVGTFGYLVAVLQSLPPGAEPAPRVAVTGGLLLALASLFALVYFIHDITRGIRVEAIMRDIERETAEAIRHVYPDEVSGAPRPAFPEAPPGAEPLFARGSGYLQAVDVDELRDAAVEANAVVRLRPKVGSHVAKGSLLGWAWPLDGAIADHERLSRHAHQALQLGFERTLRQDAVFGLGQLVDMAIKALSPAVNDPRTATEAVHHLSVLLCELGRRDLHGLVGCDAQGVPRALVERPSFDQYLALACDQIRRYGAKEPVVVGALLEMLGSCAGCVHVGRRAALLREVDLIEEAAVQQTAQASDVDRVRADAAEARARIDLLCRPGVGATASVPR
jgi:uncharacterized membrane protein